MIPASRIKWLMGVVGWISQHLSWITVLLLFIELAFGQHDSLAPNLRFFLWTERCIATFFIFEYFFRVYEDWKHPELTPDIGLGKNYITSFIGVVDLLSWLPFVLGFFLPVSLLGLVRALRVIRLFKLFRYNKHLQLIASGIYRSWRYLKSMVYGMVILILFNAILIHEVEKEAQPETFGYIGNCIWFCFVSCSTVGYGDMAPHTPLGKIVTIFFNFLPAIFVFSGMVGIAGGFLLEAVKEHNED